MANKKSKKSSVSRKSSSEPKQKAGGYRFLAILFFVLAVGGLFLGLLSSFLGDQMNYLFTLGWLYRPSTTLTPVEGMEITIPAVIKNSDALLGGSLLGVVWGVILTGIDWFKAPNIANFSLLSSTVEGSRSWTECIISMALLALVVLLVIAIVITLIMLIASFVSKSGAKKGVMCGGILTFLSYAGLFLLSYTTSCVSGEGAFLDYMFDFPTMAIAGVTLVVLIVTALARTKGMGFLNILNFIFTGAVLVALFYPTTQTASFLGGNGFDRAWGYEFPVISLTVLLGLTGLNLFLGTIRLNARKGFLFDIIRYFLQFIAAIVLMAALMMQPLEGFGKDVVFGADIIYTIVMLAGSLLAVIFSVFLMVASNKRREVKTTVSDYSAVTEPSDDYAPEVPAYDYSHETSSLEDLAENEVHKYIHEQRPAAPAPAPEPAPQPQQKSSLYDYLPESGEYSDSYLDAGPDLNPPEMEEYEPNPAPVREPVREVEPEPAPAPAPAPEPAPQPQTPIFQPNIIVQTPREEVKPREKTEFEKRMEAIARENATAPQPAATYYQPQPASPYATMPPQPYQPVFPKHRKASVQQMSIDEDTVSPYIAGNYDPFLSKLTAQEVSEFGDLFISNKFGMQNYLPVYAIGGDNDEFFSKVFIYLGKFRNYISAELLEKLNVYVSAVRSKK